MPSTPAQPVVTPGNGTLSVAFVQPDDSGSPISTDTATCSDGVDTPSVVSQLGSPIVLTASDGLIVNNSYTCQVTATNGVGVSLASPVSAAVTFATAPDAPTIPTVTRGNGTLTVAFAQPAPNGSTITTDTATCTDGVTPVSVSQLGTSIQFTGLVVGNQYHCHVTATNGVGTSNASPESTPLVTFATAPATPTIPTVTRSNGTLTVAFTQPAPNGSAITTDTATCTDGVTPVSVSQLGTSIQFTGLVAGNQYHCHVTATNRTVTATRRPRVDTVGHVRDGAGNTGGADGDARERHVDRGVHPPASNGGDPITSDTAGCTATGGVPGSATGTSPLTVSGVTVGKAYTCHVRATNGVGSSADSPESSPAVVVALTPGAPAAPTLSSGNGSITVAFTPGTSSDPVLSNTATCTATGGSPLSATGPSSPLTVNALTNGLAYACHVATTNGAGTGATVTGHVDPGRAPGPGGRADPGGR